MRFRSSTDPMRKGEKTWGKPSLIGTLYIIAATAHATGATGSSILSLDLDARLPYGPTHGTTEREGRGGNRRRLGNRRGHRAAVRDGRGEGGVRRPRRRARQAGRGGDRGGRRPGHLRGSARGA